MQESRIELVGPGPHHLFGLQAIKAEPMGNHAAVTICYGVNGDTLIFGQLAKLGCERLLQSLQEIVPHLKDR